MTTSQFIELWTAKENNLSPLDIESLLGLKLKSQTIEFLTNAGLPFDAAPFLSFVQNKADQFNSIDKLSNYFKHLNFIYDKYILIGFCNDGDIIAIDTENSDQIKWLSHEDHFSPKFFNSSINCLAECILIYRDFIQTIQNENGENAFLDANFTDQQFETLKNNLATADFNIFIEGGFWKTELDNLLKM